MKKREIALAIIFTILTCGIYGIYWLICINNDVNKLAEEPDAQSSGMLILLTLLTCGIYLMIWSYKTGRKLYGIQLKNNKPASDNSTLYLLLSLFRLDIINFALIQIELNKFID